MVTVINYSLVTTVSDSHLTETTNNNDQQNKND